MKRPSILLVASIAIFLAATPLKSIRADDAEALLQQAIEASAKGRSQEAVDLLTKVIRDNPKSAIAYYHRGREQFRLGRVKESVADFDQQVALDPKREPEHWERGISLYLVGEYERGAKQFDAYQTYLDNDVENAVWRFLCIARAEGMEQARKTLLPIKGDARVPMKEVLLTYKGAMAPQELVRSTIEAAGPNPPKSQLFYAYLYAGLYLELKGETDSAKKLIAEAAGKYRIDHYMGDVARICLARLEKDPPKAAPK